MLNDQETFLPFCVRTIRFVGKVSPSWWVEYNKKKNFDLEFNRSHQVHCKVMTVHSTRVLRSFATERLIFRTLFKRSTPFSLSLFHFHLPSNTNVVFIATFESRSIVDNWQADCFNLVSVAQHNSTDDDLELSMKLSANRNDDNTFVEVLEREKKEILFQSGKVSLARRLPPFHSYV